MANSLAPASGVRHVARRLAVAGLTVLAVLATLLARGQPDAPESFVATVAKAAEIPASKIMQPEADPPLSLIVSVIGYQPPRAGTVTAVVGLRDDHRTTHEVGRFGMFPDEAFTAARPADAQRFGIPLAAEDVALLRHGGVQLVLALEASAGGDSGARLVITAPELASAR